MSTNTEFRAHITSCLQSGPSLPMSSRRVLETAGQPGQVPPSPSCTLLCGQGPSFVLLGPLFDEYIVSLLERSQIGLFQEQTSDKFLHGNPKRKKGGGGGEAVRRSKKESFPCYS